MAYINSNVFDDLMQGLNEAVDFANGQQTGAIIHEVTPLDVKGINVETGTSANDLYS